ncbi:plastid division protein PDV2 [Typha angustifolia]|uniref:plastid division protein PDV2 n=1 Tax=Typha angustifolia TaxID=59011 RepID=UPI003C2F5437
MEGEGIGLVLARASELRSKIADYSHGSDANKQVGQKEEEEDEEEEDEETGSLLGIRAALESLEHQLTALQALQQQQIYEREAILNQIDCSRKILLSKLKIYKGQDWEVIHEAASFAGETVDHDNGLILPPYTGHLNSSFVLDDLYTPDYAPKRAIRKAKKSSDEPEENHTSRPSSNKAAPIRSAIRWVAKSVITFVSVMSILSVAGYKPILRKSGIKFDIPGLFSNLVADQRRSSLRCPPGKVLVVEDGTARCLVKERVEIPFEPDVTSPSIRYGFG